jgi:hypothetical protein
MILSDFRGAGQPQAPTVIDLAKHLKSAHITDERRNTPNVEEISDGLDLPERDQKLLIRLIHSLVAASPAWGNSERAGY